MTILYINTGSSANKGDGDTIRAAFTKANANFKYLTTVTYAEITAQIVTNLAEQRGIAVTFNTLTQQISYLVNIANANTLGGVMIGNGISTDPVTGRISVFDGNYNNLANIPQDLSTTASPVFSNLHITGSLDIAGTSTVINSTVITTNDLTLTLANNSVSASASNGAGLRVNGPTTTATITYASTDNSWNFNKRVNVPSLYINGSPATSSANLGDFKFTSNVLSTINTDEDIVINPNGAGNLLLSSTPIVFDNGFGSPYTGHLIYTAPGQGPVGIGKNVTDNGVRIVGDYVNLGNIAEFGLYDGVGNAWTNKLSVDSKGVVSSIIIKNTGTIYQGTAYDNIEYTDTAIRVDADVNSYAQMILKNHNTGTTASMDIVLMNNIGDDFTGIIDLGINSTNYSWGAYAIQTPGSGYLFTNGGDLIIGTQTPNTKLIFHAGGTSTGDSGGYLDAYAWRFNRSVQVIVDTPADLNFTVQNTSNNPSANAVYQAKNDAGSMVLIGINSSTDLDDGYIGPGHGYIHTESSATRLVIGNWSDIYLHAGPGGYMDPPRMVLQQSDGSIRMYAQTYMSTGPIIGSTTTNYTLPTARGDNGQVLSTDTTGTVTWQTGTIFTSTVPVSSTSTGITGQMAFSGTNMFICIAPNSWLKFSGVTF